MVSSNTYPIFLTRKQLQDYFGDKPDLIRALEKTFGATAQLINSGIVRPIGGSGSGGGVSAGGGSSGGVNLTDNSPASSEDFIRYGDLLNILQSLLSSLASQDSITYGDALNLLQTLYQPPLALSTMAEQSKTSVQIQGGAIDGTTIGGATPAVGAFTTLGASGLISPTSAIGVKGTSTNDSAQAGSIGEYISNSASGTSLTNNISINVTSISLTAGDWDVNGVVEYNPGAGVSLTGMQLGASTTSGAINTTTGARSVYQYAAGSNAQFISVPVIRVSISATTTVYLVCLASFSGGTCTANGFIRARRMR